MCDKHKLEIINESSFDEYSKTFTINDEDHTLANSLRYLVMKNPNVVFCGYTIPHPSEIKVNFRIQTNTNTTALDVLEKGLNDLNAQCEHILNVFQTSVHEYEQNNSIRMEC